jgi:hypothetical protein
MPTDIKAVQYFQAVSSRAWDMLFRPLAAWLGSVCVWHLAHPSWQCALPFRSASHLLLALLLPFDLSPQVCVHVASQGCRRAGPHLFDCTASLRSSRQTGQGCALQRKHCCNWSARLLVRALTCSALVVLWRCHGQPSQVYTCWQDVRPTIGLAEGSCC